MSTYPSLEEQIRAYNEELRRYYAKGHPEPIAETAAEEPAEATPPTTDTGNPENPPVSETETEPAPEEEPESEPEPEPEPRPLLEQPWKTEEAVDTDGEFPYKTVIPETEKIEVVPFTSLQGQESDLPSEEEKEAPLPETPPFGDTPPQSVEETDGTANNGDNPDIGYLQVRVFSARGAVPIVNATVSVFYLAPDGLENVIRIVQTDESGRSPLIPLPTVDRSLSLTPGIPRPFLNYIVQVNALGYVIIRNEGVTVYGGVTSVQSVPMLPLPEPQAEFQNQIVIRPGGAPPELG